MFKSLIVLHTMMRSDASVAVLSYLAGDPSAIRWRRVATSGLSEFSYSKAVTRYADYLETRAASFRELGYDIAQAGKRDRFARIRKATAAKGLLEHISQIQRVMKTLLACAFFTEDTQDELIMAALTMTLKDLMAFYMAMNEGVINMLGTSAHSHRTLL